MSEKEKLSIECGGKTFSYQGRRSERVKDVIDFIIKAPNVKGNELEVFRKNVTDEEANTANLESDDKIKAAIDDAKKAREAKKAAKAAKGGSDTAGKTEEKKDDSEQQKKDQQQQQQPQQTPLETPAVVNATKDATFENRKPSTNETPSNEQQQQKQQQQQEASAQNITGSATATPTTATTNSNSNAAAAAGMSTSEKQHINEFIQQVLQEPEADLVSVLKAKPNTDAVIAKQNAEAGGSSSTTVPGGASSSTTGGGNKISVILAVTGSETNKALIINRSEINFAELAKAAEKKIGVGALRLEFQDGDDRIDLDDDDSLEMFLDIFDRAKIRHKLTCTPLTQLSQTRDDTITQQGNSSSVAVPGVSQQQQGNYAKNLSPPSRMANTSGIVFNPHQKASLQANGGKMLKEVASFRGHTSAVYSCAFSPNSDRFVTTSRDKTIRFWNLRDSNQEPKVIRGGHNGIVLSCDASPNGEFVVTSSDDSTVKVWNSNTLDKVVSFKGHSDKVYCSQFNSSGAYVATCSCDKSVRVWNVDTASKVASLKGHTLPVFSCAFSNTDGGKYVVSGSDDRSIKIWDWRDSKDAVKTLLGHTGTVWSSKFSHDDRIIASTSMDHEIKLWDLRMEGQCLKTLGGHLTPIHHAVFSKNDKYLFTCARDWTIMCWDMEKFALVDTFQSHSNTVYHIAMSPSGTELLSCSLDETVKLWNVASIAGEKNVVGAETK